MSEHRRTILCHVLSPPLLSRCLFMYVRKFKIATRKMMNWTTANENYSSREESSQQDGISAPFLVNFRPIGIDLKTAINLMPSSGRKVFQMCSRQTCKFFEKFHSSPSASKRQSDNEMDTIRYLRWRQTFLGLQFFILKSVAQH